MKKFFLLLLVPVLLVGCRDLKLVLGDDESEEDNSSTHTENTDSNNDNSQTSGAE